MDVRFISWAGYQLAEIYTEEVEVSVPVCAPEIYGSESRRLNMTGHEIKPSMSAQVDTVPCGRVINTYPLPRNS